MKKAITKLSVEERFAWFKQKAKEIHKNKYNYDDVVYKNAYTKIKIFCKKCNKYFEQRPDIHLTNHGCPYCANNKQLTTEEFIKKAKNIYNEQYDYTQVKYVNSKIKVLIHCNRCNSDFWQLPASHLRGCGCKHCIDKYNASKNIISSKEWLKRFRKVHGNKYIYLDIPTNILNKITIKCKKCGNIFKQGKQIHLRGSGCPFCNSTVITKNDFIKKAISIHKGIYKYDLAAYKNASGYISIFCTKCKHTFKQRVSKHIRGQGCPYCSQSKGELSIIRYLDKYKIKYITQHRFKDCKDKRPLPFDFYLPDFNCCIEYQGQQHYDKTYHKWKNDPVKNFAKQQYHDIIKKEFCKSNQVNLLEIRYDEDIEKKLNEFFKFK